MRVLSIDVGTKNLGLCELELQQEAGSLRILRWEVVGFDAGDVQQSIAGAVGVMSELWESTGNVGWDCVVIENQPCMKNPRMKTVQVAIHTFLVLNGGPETEVVLAGAGGKTKVAKQVLGPQPKETDAGKKYRAGKKQSISATTGLLTSFGLDEHQSVLKSSKKKDDLCDAFLQGVYYLSLKTGKLSIPEATQTPV